MSSNNPNSRKRSIGSILDNEDGNDKKRRKLNPESLSDDESHESDKLNRISLTTQQMNSLEKDGYCMMDDAFTIEQREFLIEGYIRKHFNPHGMTRHLRAEIDTFYGSKWNPSTQMKLLTAPEDGPYFLITKQSAKLSTLLSNTGRSMIHVSDKVSVDELPHVLQYLGHHKGIEPAPLPSPIPSINMSRVVSDKWDATFIDAFDKKVIFNIISIANYMGIPSLLHLGCAKIATLIKGLSPAEITNILSQQ
eukprot:354098_1